MYIYVCLQAQEEIVDCFRMMDPSNTSFVSWPEVFIWFLGRQSEDHANMVFREELLALGTV
jgi:hypothetical protein